MRRTKLDRLVAGDQSAEDFPKTRQTGRFSGHGWVSDDQRSHDRRDLRQIACWHSGSGTIPFNDQILGFEVPQQCRTQEGLRRCSAVGFGRGRVLLVTGVSRNSLYSSLADRRPRSAQAAPFEQQ
ncbi:MAG: hypothetical protein WCG92_16685, partial [Hyphomicrobiales bacterium]